MWISMESKMTKQRQYLGSYPVFASGADDVMMAMLLIDVIVLLHGCPRSDDTCIAHGHLAIHIAGSADVEVQLRDRGRNTARKTKKNKKKSEDKKRRRRP